MGDEERILHPKEKKGRNTKEQKRKGKGKKEPKGEKQRRERWEAEDRGQKAVKVTVEMRCGYNVHPSIWATQQSRTNPSLEPESCWCIHIANG